MKAILSRIRVFLLGRTLYLYDRREPEHPRVIKKVRQYTIEPSMDGSQLLIVFRRWPKWICPPHDEQPWTRDSVLTCNQPGA